MSRPFAAVESFLERILERPAARLFHAHPQPVQLERRIERAMTAHKMVRGGHTYVPSRYRIVLNPADLVALREATDQLPDDLADAILPRARSQGYWLVARPEVLLVPSERITQGDLEVDAEPLDPSLVSSAAAGLRPVELEGPRPPRPPIPGTGVVPDPIRPRSRAHAGYPTHQRHPWLSQPGELPAPAVSDRRTTWSLASMAVEVSPATSSPIEPPPIEPPGAAAQAEAAHMASDVRERCRPRAVGAPGVDRAAAGSVPGGAGDRCRAWPAACGGALRRGCRSICIGRRAGGSSRGRPGRRAPSRCERDERGERGLAEPGGHPGGRGGGCGAQAGRPTGRSM